MTCHTCIYAEPRVGDDGSVFTVCRRYPPQVIALEDKPAIIWPQVRGDDWCGEHVESRVVMGHAPGCDQTLREVATDPDRPRRRSCPCGRRVEAVETTDRCEAETNRGQRCRRPKAQPASVCAIHDRYEHSTNRS